MGNVWDKPITADTDWGGDASTNNLPVSGRQVQAWIKGSIKNDTQISQLVTAWFNQNTTKSNTFWKGLPIDTNVLKWENNLLTIIEREDNNSTNIDEEYLNDFIKNYLTENKYITAEELPFVYDAVKKTCLFEGDLVVTGAISMFSNLTNFTPSTVMDAVQVDGTTIAKNAQGQLTVIGGGGSGGTGGGLTAAEVNLLIANALSPVNENIATKWTQDDTKIANWDAAYNWGDHSTAGYAIKTRKISTGTGLIGGGDLSADRTISLDTVGTAGTYTKVTTDAYGRVKNGATLAVSDIPPLDWSKITSGKPTTISGYGITDAYTKEQINTEFAKYILKDTAQEISAQHNFVNGFEIGGLAITKSQDDVIYIDANLVVRGAVTMFGSGATIAPSIWESIPFDDTMEWNGSEWSVVGGGSGSVNEATVNNLIYEYLAKNSYAKISDISSALTGYATQTWVGNNYLSLSGGSLLGGVTITSGNLIVSQGDTVVGNLYPKGDTTINLGQGVRKWKDIYLGGYLVWGSSVDSTDSANWETIKSNYGLRIISSITTGSGAPYQYATALHVKGRYGFELAVQGGDVDSFAIRSITHDREWKEILHSGNYTDYFTKANIKTTLGISDWALAATKPSYTAAEVGAYKADCAAIPTNVDLASLSAGSYWVGENLGAASPVRLSYSSLSVLGNSYYSAQINISHNAQTAYIRGVYNIGSNSVSDWHELAFTDSNVASATKLATPRTIWGQSFDGTGNVDGNLTLGIDNSTTDQYLFRMYRKVGSTRNRLLMAILDSNDLEFSYYDHASTYKRLIFGTNDFQFLGGNVAIGGTSAGAKLHVHGDTRVDGKIIVNPSDGSDVSINFQTGTVSDGSYDYKVGKFTDANGKTAFGMGMAKSNGSYTKFFGITTDGEYNVTSVDIMARNASPLILESTLSSGSYMTLKTNSGVKGYIGYSSSSGVFLQNGTTTSAYIAISDAGNIGAYGNTTINGDLLVTGAVTMFSQLSMKNVIDYDGLSLAQLEQIKPARFTWKDGRDSLVHVGGIADDVMQILPEVIHRTSDDKLTMDYGSAAFYIGASLIQPVIDHERRIADLERENKQLKQQLEQLSAA